MTDTTPSPPPEPGGPPGAPAPAPAPAATGGPEVGTTGTADAPTQIPRWLLAGVVVVVVAAVVVVGLILLGGDDDGDGDGGGGGGGEVIGRLPERIDDSTAASPLVTLASDTLWDLDRGVFTSRFGNTCSYSGPVSFVGCTLIGGDPDRRVGLDGADVSIGGSIGPADGAQLLGPETVPGCPSTVSVPAGDEPLSGTPALCVMSSEGVPFAVFVTGVADDGSVTARAAEVVR